MTGIFVTLVVVSSALAFLASALHFALRDFSLRKLEDIAGRNGGMDRLRTVVDEADAHALSMGAFRSLAVAAMIIGVTLLLPITSDDGTHAALWIAIALVICTLLMYVVAVIVPSSVADHAGEHLIHRFQLVIKLVHAAFYPLRGLLVIDTVVRYLAGTHRVTEQEELEDELLDVATEGEREGNLSESERKMIEAVIELRSRSTQEIMTPRTEMDTLAVDATLDEVREMIKEAGHSRIPVYEGDHDHIVGILYAKDLLRFVGEGGHDTDGFDLRATAREALFVPENKPAGELLIELQAKNVHMVIVLDEYGGTTGLVTLEDIIEEIVGDIRDEYEPEHEQPPAIEIDIEQKSADIEARAFIHEANRILETVDIELPESEHYDTVGGYALAELGHIPVSGESFRKNGYLVTVLEAEPTRVHKLRIEMVEHHDDASVVPTDAAAESSQSDSSTTEP
ncbi:MAG: hemolysin family protein [Planctomycetota bacterium]